MKKSTSIILAAVLALLLSAGSYLYLRFSPNGSLNPSRPGDAVQEYLHQVSGEELKGKYIEQVAHEVTPFENAKNVAAAAFDAAGEGEFSFSRDTDKSTETNPVYLISKGGLPLFHVTLAYTDGAWRVTDCMAAEPDIKSYSATVLLPPDAELTLNGKTVDECYIVDSFVPYDNLTELEEQFDEVPHRVKYEVRGLYLNSEIDVQRENGILLAEYASDENGSVREYLPSDAAGYSFRISVPLGASVNVCGAELDQDNQTEIIPYETKLSIPAELEDALPTYAVYEAAGLYTKPEIRVMDSKGTELTGAQQDNGTIAYFSGGAEDLYEACHARVEEYLVANCHYGAGHTGIYYPAAYCVPYSDIWYYYINAIYSLIWVQGVNLTINEASSSDYIPLGENAFLCRGHVNCQSVTGFQTNDLLLDYEMLWQNLDGYWMLADMAFA